MGDHVPREMIIRSCSLRQNPAYRPGNSLPLLTRLLVLVVAAACRRPVPQQTISPPRPVPVPVVEVPRAWTIRPGSLAREYHIEQRARIVATLDSGGPVTDSISVIVDASVRNVPGGGVAGLIRLASVAAPGAAPTALSGLVFPYAFDAAEPTPGRQSVPTGQPNSPDPCASPAQVPLGVLRDVLVRTPDSLSLGREWSDSGSFVTCRDGVRLNVTSQRRFRLTGFMQRDGSGILAVTRTGTTQVRGVSVYGDDTTRVEGSGTHSMQYELDATTGQVVSVSGTGSLDIVVRGVVKSQRARQTSSVRAVLRTP